MKKTYTPNIHRYNPPKWFCDADFGIFIHWGASSIPAFAPVDVDDYGTLMKEKPMSYVFANMPYAEWYPNSMKFPGSPAQVYHEKNFKDKPYDYFVEEFKKHAKNVDVEKWAELFQKSGAKYVVVVSKHHDGFVMFDTNIRHPKKEGWHLDFDFVGNLATAVRKRGMKFGVYYSSLIDWSFKDRRIDSAGALFMGQDNSKLYRDYCLDQWVEIIDRYMPDVLWSDIGYPTDNRLEDLFHYYYSKVPEGVVNDRWGQWPNLLRNKIGENLINKGAKATLEKNSDVVLDTKYYDFRTLEYNTNWQESDIWFEVCRGMDKSFGFNQYSRPQDYITPEEVIKIINDIYPKKGRLLLNAGPDKYGVIPEYQVEILKKVGKR